MQYSFALTGAALVATVAAGEYAAPSSSTCTESTSAPAYTAPVYSAPVYTSSVKTVEPITYTTPVASPVWTTKVVSSYETYCPEATTIVHGAMTYTATSATTLTITDCPCTLTHAYTPTSAPYVAPTSAAPVYTSAAAASSGAVSQISDHQPQAPTVAPASSAAPVASGAVSQISDHQPQAPTVAPASSAAPVATAAPVAPAPVYSNSTGSAAPSGTVSSKPATYTGAASKAFTASGAGLAAIFGLVAYVL